MSALSPTVDWRQYDTPEFRNAFSDAQARLDDGDYEPGEAGAVLRQCDQVLTDRYDRLVLQPAQDEFERQCEEDEFNARFPEPANGSRIEWETAAGRLYAAFRQDDDAEVGQWYLYGKDRAYTWRQLLGEFEYRMDDLALLVPAEVAR